MENLKRNLKFQFMESKSFILKFWLVILILDMLFIFFSYTGGKAVSIGISKSSAEIDLISILGVNLMIILISLVAYNYERNYGSFPLAVSLSMTRKEYYVSFLADNIFIALVFATIQGILMKIDPFFVKLIGRNPLYDLQYFNTKTDNVFYIILILFIIFLGFISFLSLVASLNYKIGPKMWLIALGIFIIFSYSNIHTIIKIPKVIKDMFTSRLGASQFVVIFIGIFIFYVLNYLIVIRSNIKGKAN